MSYSVVAVLPVTVVALRSIDEGTETQAVDALLLRIAPVFGLLLSAGLHAALLFHLLGRRVSTSREVLGLVSASPRAVLSSLGAGTVAFMLLNIVSSRLDAQIPVALGSESDEFLALFLVAAVAIGPTFEEILYRGFLVGGLHEARVSRAYAVAASAIAWSAAHRLDTTGDYAVTAVLGVLLGVIRTSSGSILPCVIVHVLWSLGIVLYLAAS